MLKVDFPFRTQRLLQQLVRVNEFCLVSQASNAVYESSRFYGHVNFVVLDLGKVFKHFDDLKSFAKYGCSPEFGSMGV